MADNHAYTVDEHPGNHRESDASIQFSPDMQIDYENLKPYAGMPKEVLLRFSRQKKYVYARNILTICVFVALLLLLSLIIAFIAISPACQAFWKTSPIYEIYPLSYKDSDGDGKGDIQGIISKLDYLNNDLGVKTIVLKGFTDPSDLTAVHPDLGNNDDVIDLLTAAHAKGMYVSLEMIPNYTSDKHPWFIASQDPTDDTYKDFYIWESTGSTTTPPNNWQNVRSSPGSSGSAWKYDSTRSQFYYHAFEDSFPDLNFRNEKVRTAFKEVLRFWLDLNVDGFRFSFINYLYESTHLRDQELIDPAGAVIYSNMYSDFTKDLPEIHDLLMDWRSLLDEYSTEPGVYRFMETETDIGESSEVLTRYYGNEYTIEADLPVNLRMVELDSASLWTGTRIGAEIVDWMENMPRHKWANWRLGTSLSQRLLSRVGDDEQLARCASVISTTLSGSSGIYYGEEIGMTSDGSDNSQLTPMQWDTTGNAGFTAASAAWMEVNDNYLTGTNVEEQLADRNSMIHLYKKLINMRSDLVFLRGSLCMVAIEDDFLAYVRELPGIKSILVVINFSDVEIDAGEKLPDNHFPSTGIPILYNSVQPDEGCDCSGVDLSLFRMQPKRAMVLEFDPVGQFSDDSDYSCYVADPVCQNGIGLLQKC